MARIYGISKIRTMYLMYLLDETQIDILKKTYRGDTAAYMPISDEIVNLNKFIRKVKSFYPDISKIYLVAKNLSPIIRATYNGNARYAERNQPIQLLEFDDNAKGLFETQILFTN